MSRDGPKGAGGESCCVRQPCRKETPAGGMTRRLRRERWGCRPEGAVLSFEAKESTKESQRHGDSRGGPPRCASRASVCGSRTVGRPEFIRGIQFRPKGRNSLTTFRGQTALRGCPRPRFAALTRREKALYCPFWRRGSQCRAQWNCLAFTYGRSALVLAFFRRQNGRAFFPSLPIAARLSRSWHWADSTNASWDVALQLGWLRSTENSIDFFFCAWHYAHSTSVA